ncbi:glucose-dependent insulinotropic receptor-like [Heteronotia binoei]|uniref:glucose-dependent insulinotropic receptor-like n=1 Tax=Heteronotia binoei TaxID=13085 RepID=UPI002930D07D|nr:glucose-dependent insulinotropic receptor-like [Heteronotia binoei]
MPNLMYAVLHFLLSILIPSTNLIVIRVIWQLRKKKPSRNYIFILNLAAADLLVGVMCFGEALDDAIDIALDRNLTICLLRICISITPCIGSILTLLLVSLDRYLAVKLPLYYPTLMRKKPIIFSLVVLWSVSLLVGHMPLYYSYLQQSNFTVGRIAYLQHMRIRHAFLHMDTSSAHFRHFKALRTVLVVIICFILFWGPYYVAAIVKATCSSCILSPLLKNLLFILGETNSLVNPFIYSLYSKDIRTQLSKLMKCKTKGQIKPCRANDLALIHFNMRAQCNFASGGATKRDSSGDQASNSPTCKSSSDFRAVFSIS